MSSVRSIFLAAAAVFLSTSAAHAIVLLTNDAIAGSDGFINIRSNNRHVIEFTMPGDDYTFDAFTVSLGAYNSSTETLNFGIYGDNEGLPGALVGMLSNPASSSDSVSYFTFTSPTQLVLQASQTYWISMGVQETDATVRLMASSSPAYSGEATFDSFRLSGDSGASYSGNFPAQPSFTIEGTPYSAAVPEPSTYGLLAALGTLGFVFWRRKHFR